MANVPNVPGVPALSSYLSSAITLLVVDAVSLLFGSPESLWNVFLNGSPAFDFKSIVGFDYKQDWTIADYPVENGAFFSYDKVQLPFQCRLRITSGGTEQDRQLLIDEIEAAANSLDLYDVVTPEKVYSNCNISHISYDRTAMSGVGMMVIDVAFQEIRSSEASAFSNTQQPGSANQKGVGNVQPQSPPASVVQRFPLGALQ